MTHHHSQSDRDPPRFWSARYGIGLFVLGAVAAWLLLVEHRAHALGALPYLLLLACPLMHVFMHRGHGGHGAHGRDRSPGDSASPPRDGASAPRDGPGEAS